MIKPYYEEENIKIYNGNAINLLEELDSESINCVVTSPPYWALRDYQTKPIIWDGDKNCEHDWNIRQYSKVTNYNEGFNQRWENSSNRIQKQSEMGKLFSIKEGFCTKCGAWKGSLGLEPTFDLYIKHLVDIFDEVKRVLRKDGTVWVVIGDSYSGSGKAGKNPNYQKKHTEFGKPSTHSERFGLPTTNIGLPDKSLVMIPFRFAIEMVNRGWMLRNTIIWHKPNCMPSSVKDRFTVDFEYIFFFVKNKKYYFEQQFDKTLTKDNSYRNRDITKLNNTPGRSRMGGLKVNNYDFKNKRSVWQITTKPFKEAHFAVYPPELIETPIKAGCPENGIVLDPFMGSGTTLKVARKFGRKSIGIELNKDYINIAVKRLGQGVLDFK